MITLIAIILLVIVGVYGTFDILKQTKGNSEKK